MLRLWIEWSAKNHTYSPEKTALQPPICKQGDSKWENLKRPIFKILHSSKVLQLLSKIRSLSILGKMGCL